MRPTTLRSRPGGNGDDKERDAFKRWPKVLAKKPAIEAHAQILMPWDAPEPILAKPVQAAIAEWMIELQNGELLMKAKIEPRRTCMLFGPPGTGKTTLAHNLAGRLDKPLVAIQSEKLVGKYLGETTQNMGRMFDMMDEIGDEAIVLFDEFDAIAQKRKSDKGGGAVDEMNRAVTVILRRLEQFKGIAIAATNTDKAIDAAVWRRFGLQMSVDLPEWEERVAIIVRYLKPYFLYEEDVHEIAWMTEGCSPSLLKQLIEGVKRAVVLGPLLPGRDVSNPVQVFTQIVAAVSPPDEMKNIALWEKWKDPAKNPCNRLSKITWPMPLEEQDGPDREAA